MRLPAALVASLALVFLLGCGLLRREVTLVLPTATPEAAQKAPVGATLASAVTNTVTAIAAKPSASATAPAAPTAAAAATKMPVGFKSFRSTTYPYSVIYPNSWTARDAGVKTEDVTADLFMSGKKSAISPGQTFESNINIMAEDLPSGVSLDDYLEANLENITISLGQEPDWGDGPDIAGESSYWIWYYMPGDDYEVAINQYVLVAGDRGWVLTLATLPDDEDVFLPTLDKMAESFKLEK